MKNKNFDGIKKIYGHKPKGPGVVCRYQPNGGLRPGVPKLRAGSPAVIKNIVALPLPRPGAKKRFLDFKIVSSARGLPAAKPAQKKVQAQALSPLRHFSRPEKKKFVFLPISGAALWAKAENARLKKIFENFNFRSPQLKAVWKKIYQEQRVPVMAAVMALFLAFGGGFWAELSTSKTEAVDQSTQPGPVNYQVIMPNAKVQVQSSSVSGDMLFNTPIQYLKNYLASVAEPGIIERRKNQIADFLTEKKSPLASAAETIAQQPHWQLILAIAFAESTLGRNCADNNCSNIGSRPGALNWKIYSSYQSWVVDFNRLLNNKRYKNMTLEQMCGVYVQPCNPNWLAATSQILGELKDKGIN